LQQAAVALKTNTLPANGRKGILLSRDAGIALSSLARSLVGEHPEQKAHVSLRLTCFFVSYVLLISKLIRRS